MRSMRAIPLMILIGSTLSCTSRVSVMRSNAVNFSIKGVSLRLQNLAQQNGEYAGCVDSEKAITKATRNKLTQLIDTNNRPSILYFVFGTEFITHNIFYLGVDSGGSYIYSFDTKKFQRTRKTSYRYLIQDLRDAQPWIGSLDHQKHFDSQNVWCSAAVYLSNDNSQKIYISVSDNLGLDKHVTKKVGDYISRSENQ